MKSVFKVTTLIIALLLASCVPETPRTRKDGVGTDKVETTPGDGNTGNGGDGDGAVGSGGTGLDETTLALGKVELTQIIDPNTDTFRKKVSIPKDYEGMLYISGLNIAALKGKVISARFKFGREKSPITIPAVVGRVPGGLTPLSSIDVVILDMESRPFRELRLLYDLYDYNDYDEDSVTPKDPTNDPTNAGLYCRGLKLENDPTWEIDSDGKCDDAGETCLYAYASVIDTGLYSEQTDPDTLTATIVSAIPELEQYDSLGSGYASESFTQNLKKCLPDTNQIGELAQSTGQTYIGTTIPAKTTVGTTDYFWLGPYKELVSSEWEIEYQSAAIVSDTSTASTPPTGLYKHTVGGLYGYRSFLFPRAGKINYATAGLQYFGSNNPFDPGRTIQTLPSAGDTLWMDGCNLRAKNYEPITGETISSCNVTATIEIIAETNGKVEVLATSDEVKVQLIKAGLGITQGKSFTAMKKCVDNKGCGTGECCFNEHCWSRDLVGQCSDDLTPTGNLGTGDSCNSDFDCASLCCNQTTGVCNDHINNDLEQVLCSKVPSQTCVTREFCRQENVRECYVITTTDTNGNPSCEKKCFTVPRFGDCVDGICRPPNVPAEPNFDPTDPNRCNPSGGQYQVFDSPPIVL